MIIDALTITAVVVAMATVTTLYLVARNQNQGRQTKS
jgi:multisubunit Na+/H+ antiporter MnhC subunit